MLEWQFLNKDDSSTTVMLDGPEPDLGSATVREGRNYVVRCVLIDRPDGAPDLVIAEEE